jgi:choline-sulfatase
MRNVILLTIDAWRSDFVDAHEGVALMPALAPHAARTVRFDRAYANGPWTTPALVSVFTGESAARHGVHYEWSAPRPDAPGVVKTLRAKGFHCPNLCYLNRLDNYDHLGFDRAEAPQPPHDWRDATLLDAIAATPEPFFLWFHYKYVHLPYWPEARYRAMFDVVSVPAHLRDSVGTGFVVPRHQHRLDAADAPIVRRMYAAGVRQASDFVARVFDAIEARAVADRTALVLTSDHGEELLDHGHVGHASTAHHAQLHDEVLRIPLLVVDPRVTAPRRVETRVQGLDLYPTLHTLAGLAAPSCEGVDLTPTVLGVGEPAVDPHRPFYFRAARKGCPTPRELASHITDGYSDGRVKVIRERWDAETTAAYDLAADPFERSPRATLTANEQATLDHLAAP